MTPFPDIIGNVKQRFHYLLLELYSDIDLFDFRYELLDELERTLLLGIPSEIKVKDLPGIELLFNSLGQHFDEMLEERLKKIEDPFIRNAERIFLSLPQEKIESFETQFILLNLRTFEIIGHFDNRTEAHLYAINHKLDLKKYYLRKVDLSPLMVF